MKLPLAFQAFLLGLAITMVMLITSCNSSPTQASFRLALLTFDNRTFYEVAGNVTNDVRMASGGHGSNSRVYSDTLQGMVLYKSPMTASSNSTPVSFELPIK